MKQHFAERKVILRIVDIEDNDKPNTTLFDILDVLERLEMQDEIYLALHLHNKYMAHSLSLLATNDVESVSGWSNFAQ